MSTRRKYIWRIGGALVVLAVIVALGPVFMPPGSEPGGGEPLSAPEGRMSGAISLARPAFAAGGQMAGMNFLEEEAGISAFTNVGRKIDLVDARGAFRTIERETDEYIIGSVGLPGLEAAHDVHVFVHRDGWVVAYYSREAAIARIVDWRDLTTTKLEPALKQVTRAARVAIGEVNYYDFRHPEAEKLMIIVDDDSFNLKIPGALTVFERSFSANLEWPGSLRINEATIASDTGIHVGQLTPGQLRSEAFHTVQTLRGRVAIVILYKEP